MNPTILISIWGIIFVFVVALTYKLSSLKQQSKFKDHPKELEQIGSIQNVVYAILVAVCLIGVAILFLILKGTIYEILYLRRR